MEPDTCREQTNANDKKALNRAQIRSILREAEKTDELKLEKLTDEGLLAVAIEAGRRELQQMCEQEADMLCKAGKGQHNSERTGYRHGTIESEICLGGKKIKFRRPRLRGVDGGELILKTYAAARDPQHLDEAILAQCISGVSQRDYQESTDTLIPTQNSQGVSKSSVSRRFIKGTQKILGELLSRPITEEYLVLFVDGKQVGDHHIISALGVTADGEKHILGIWEGASENAEVARALLMNMQERGFSIQKRLLVVIDGGKGLRKAIGELWGERVKIQRCRIHKKRNITDKLPEKKHEWVSAKLNRAWNHTDPCEAELELKNLAHLLREQGYEQAANSLLEGLSETLTVNRLKVPASLLSSLTNTNTIESAFSHWQEKHRRVKRWRSGSQVLRWAAVGLTEAEKSFNILKGASALPRLAQCLKCGPNSAQETVSSA